MSSWHDIGTARGNPNSSAVHAYTSVWVLTGPLRLSTELRTTSRREICRLWTRIRITTFTANCTRWWPSITVPPGNSVRVQYAGDSSGNTWQPMVKAMAGSLAGPLQWDFPSMAADSNSGRIVVGASQISSGGQNSGYRTSSSTDGGASWSGPYSVNGGTGGATSKIVWSSSGFYAFIQTTTDPSACTYNQNRCVLLRHWTSPDGQTWTQAQSVATYGVPLLGSLTNVVAGPPVGALSYASTPDAVASPPGFGWVIAYPVNIGGLNAINVSTELAGGVTITWNYDLNGIIASPSGDWYLTYHNPGGSPIYSLQGVVYRTSSGSYIGATIQSGIDPSQWWYYNYSAGRCPSSAPACYAAGDWFRPAMNRYTGASVPMILGSCNLNDLYQDFINDPQASNVKQFFPKIEPFVNGSDISSRAVLTSAHVQAIALHSAWALQVHGFIDGLCCATAARHCSAGRGCVCALQRCF